MKVFTGENPCVAKLVFEFPNAVAEAVLYKYPTYQERTVLCISLQSGCVVGCTFCGTGKKFLRNLTKDEIIYQVTSAFEWAGLIDPFNEVKKLQIMFMSMGEPFHNYDNLENSIIELNNKYPNADLLVSTISPNQPKEMIRFIELSKQIDKIGLQFSIHESSDKKRNILIPYKNKMSLTEIRDYGVQWWNETGRKPYCNYCVNGKNNTIEDFYKIRLIFPPNVFCFTFSVICSKECGGNSFRNKDKIQKFERLFMNVGYDTRKFDPAGQDDIGGGCGQLWYVQEYMKRHSIK